MGDYIESLPTDNNPLNLTENMIVETLLHDQDAILSPRASDAQQPSSSSINRFIADLKQPILIGMVFLVLSLKSVSDLIKSLIPLARNNPTSLLLVKTFIFIAILYVLKKDKN